MSCTEERDDGTRSVVRWREEAHSLEKTNVDTRQLISILEEDIRAGRKEYEALKSNTEKLASELRQVRDPPQDPPIQSNRRIVFNRRIEIIQMRFSHGEVSVKTNVL